MSYKLTEMASFATYFITVQRTYALHAPNVHVYALHAPIAVVAILETLTCCKRVETTRTFVLVVDTAKVCSTYMFICFWRVETTR